MPTPQPSFDPVAALTAADAATNHKLDPQTLSGAVKSASSTTEAITNARSAAHFGNVVKEYDTLNGMQPSAQASAWEGMTQTEQESLKAVGYKPPNLTALTHTGAGGQHGGVWGFLASGWHDLTSAADAVWHAGGTAVRDTLGVAGAPVRFFQHLWRAAQYHDESYATQHGIKYTPQSSAFQAGSAKDITTGGSWLSGFSPSAWEQAWNATNTGNRTLDPGLARSLNNKWGKANVQLALRVLNTGATAVIKGATPKQRSAMSQQIQDPKFTELLTQVQNSRMSFGRSIVGERFLNDHPEAGKVLSGSLDAAFDIASTPLLKAGKAKDAFKEGYYAVRDASDVTAALNRPAVQRYVSQVGKYLANGDVAGLARFDPRLDSVAQSLVDKGIDSADGFKGWLAGEVGSAAVMAGKLARPAQGFAMMPRLTVAGWAKASIKAMLQNSIDDLADGKVKSLLDVGEGDTAGTLENGQKVGNLEQVLSAGRAAGQEGKIPGVSNVSRLVRRATTLIQTKPYLDIGAEPDVANLRRFLQGYLPARNVNEVIDVFLSSDQGQRYRIVSAARQQLFHTLGFYNTTAGAAMADKLLAALDDFTREQTYSTGKNDLIKGENDLSSPAAVLEPQLSTRVALPMPNAVRRALRQTGVLNSLHINPIIAADRFMYYWRSMVLDRPGFAARIALTENLSRLLRLGPRKFIGSYLAQGAAPRMSEEDIAGAVERAISAGADERDREALTAAVKAKAMAPVLPYHPVERSLAILAEHIPEGIRPFIDTPAKFYGAVVGTMARKAIRAAQVKGLKVLGLEHYITAATDLFTHQPVADAFQDLLSSMHGVQGYIWTPGAVLKALKDDAEGTVARLKMSSEYSSAGVHDALFGTKWQFSLDQVAHSKLGRAVLESIDKTPRTQERAVLRALTDPEFAETKLRFLRNTRLPDGRAVGIDATQDEADRAWARTVVKHVNSLVRAGDPKKGPVLQNLVDEMLANGRGPSDESIAEAAKTGVPPEVYGPDLLAVHKITSFFSKSFEQIVGRPVNWMVRQPMFISAYGDALQDTRKFAEERMNRVFDADTLTAAKTYRTLDEVDEQMREFGELPDQALVRVYHGTDKESADALRSAGKVAIPKGATKNGSELPSHLYVTATAGQAREYGEHVASFVVRKGALRVPPEAGRATRATSLADALFRHDDGAVLRPGAALSETAPRSENAEKLASDLATQRAMNASIPFVHNPALRTQFEDYHRILMPFLFAQRQFLQRWGRLMSESPEAIRKLQLTMNGLRTMGIVKKNATGETYFYYPGSQYVQELVTTALTKLGVKSSIPLVTPFTGQVQYLMPGLANPTTPSFGPFAAFGMKELSKMFPELNGAEQTLLGQGATTPSWQQFTPTLFNRLWNALGPVQKGSELASTTMQAIKYLDAAGYTPPNNATPQQIEQYASRVENWARSLLVVRAALGFVLPSTPTATLDPRGLNQDFQNLLSQMPYTTAVATFVKEHPTATAYTVGESKVDGYTPATASTTKWINDNLPFAEAYPQAAAWFSPKSGTGFTAAGYREQIALGMRTQRAIANPTGTRETGFLTEVIMARASNAYYTTLDRYSSAYTSTTSSAEHQQLTHWWDQWKASFFKRNPVFATYVQSGSGARHRTTTIQQVESALSDPRLPQAPINNQLKTVIDQYNAFVDAYTATVGIYSSGSTAQRRELKTQMTDWLKGYANSHPQVKDFIQTVMLFQVEAQK